MLMICLWLQSIWEMKMHKITKVERENLFRAFRHLNSLSEKAIKDDDDDESLARQLGTEETVILLAILTLDENKLVEM